MRKRLDTILRHWAASHPALRTPPPNGPFGCTNEHCLRCVSSGGADDYATMILRLDIDHECYAWRWELTLFRLRERPGARAI